jgi:hypothetical protein
MFILLTVYSTVGRKLQIQLMTDAALGAAVVDDLFGIRSVAPTSRFPNADVGILDG